MPELLSSSFDVTKLYDGVAKLANLYRNELINANLVASGKLVSFTTDISWNGQQLVVYFNLPSYYIFPEEGRKKTVKADGTKLVDIIRRWIDQKGINPADGDKDSLAYAITSRIHKEGYFRPGSYGKHPLRNALDKAQNDGTIDNMVSTVTDGLGNEIKVSLNELTDLTKK